MTATAITPMPIPADWMDWLKLNLERGCPVSGLIKDMQRNGKFTRQACNAAIGLLRGETMDWKQLPLPDIATNGNAITIQGRKMRVLMTCNSPRIVLLENVISDAECDALIGLADSKFHRSKVIGTDGSDSVHEGRNSQSAFIDDAQTPEKLEVESRLAELTNWPVENGEGLQLLRYDAGGEFTPHFDWFEPGTPAGDRHLPLGGQRVGTLILYLSDVDEGGITSFPSLGLDFYPQKGSALFFQNTDEMHIGDPDTLHAGRPVIKGVKYVANKWLRANKFGYN